MTVTAYVRRIIAPVVSAVVTAVVIGGALWIQHRREAWPFTPAATPVAALQGTVPAATAGQDPNHGRVPVDVSPTVTGRGSKRSPVATKTCCCNPVSTTASRGTVRTRGPAVAKSAVP